MAGAGIYIGYVGHDNLGDEAMWDVCRLRFPGLRWSTFALYSYPSQPATFLRKSARDAGYFVSVLKEEFLHQTRLRRFTRKTLHRIAASSGGEVGMLGGGTLINSGEDYLNAYLTVRRRTGRLVPVFGSGVMSAEFWAGQAGWKDRRGAWVESLAELPIVGVRGPQSKALLDEAGAQNVVISGDPAIWFHSKAFLEGRACLQARLARVAINCGGSHSSMWGTAESIEDVLAGTASTIIREGHTVELFAVCPEDMESCVRVAKKAGLPESAIAPPLFATEAFLQRAKNYHAVVALKLHAAVLAAATNVPFLVLEYRPKCLDFALSIGWERFAFRTSTVSTRQLSEKVLEMIVERPRLEEELCARVCALADRFAGYCRQIEPLLTRSRQIDGETKVATSHATTSK